MIKKAILAILAIAAAGGLLVGNAYYQAVKTPSNNVEGTLKTAVGSDKKIAVCLGDSITHGTVSFDYVKHLSDDPALRDFVFVNEGINSRLAYHLLPLVGRVAALKPRYIFILIGTNDLKGSLSKEEYRRYDELWSLPQRPTKKWFTETYKLLVDELKAKTGARITLISIPPLGERADSEPFRLAADYSKAIKEIASEKKVSYIPLNEILSAELDRRGKKDVKPYSMDEGFMYRSIAKRYLLRKTWDTISDDRGLLFMPDNIHLNERGGKILAERIKMTLTGPGK
ncbi:MAG: SGNH/GDSL hydrolase family protein [Spirochaetes bacterium]|nr:SGNH/GDSL hydrolase family protein [Spirochaetota bacterium]